jgi:subtilisin family serine protease
MRPGRLWPALVLVLVSAAASAAPRLSARVRMVASGQLAARYLGVGGDDRAHVLVEVDGGAAALQALGFDAQPLTARRAAVRAGSDELARLVARPEVRAVEERHLLHPLLDKSAAAIFAPQGRMESGVDGTGTLVGIVDTGIDFRHADLRHSDGKTRLEALFDASQSNDGRHPELGDYTGRIWLRDEIDAQLAADATMQTAAVPVTEQDVNGHGTHVAGITASNGLATDHGFPAGRYVGIAPGADLIVVQATNGGASFTDTDVLNGLQVISAYAQKLGRPLAVNLSLGGPGGPHDGSSQLEQAIDEIFPADRPGQVVVVAAGNDGSEDLHGGASMIDGEVVLPLALDRYTDADGSVAIEIWYQGALSIAVETPGGHLTAGVPAGQSLTTDQLVTNHTAEGKIVINNDAQPHDDGRTNAGISLVGPSGASPVTGTWKLHVRGQATRFDAWVVESPSSAAPAKFTGQIDEDERVGLPATAHNVIVVGSFGSRDSWTTVDGMSIQRTNVIGAPSTFSSSGPSSDGRFVPDVLAPGEYIISALSADAHPDMPGTAFYVPGHPTFGWADDGLHAVLRGTSQASPHVAGACALLLQANPALDVGAIREILRVTAHAPPAGWAPREGFGQLDVAAALRYLRGQRGTAVDATASIVGVSRDLLPPGDATTVVTVTPRDASGVPIGPGHTITIDASAGTAVGDVVDTGWGRYERTFAAHAPRGSVARISVTADGVALAAHPAVYIAADRSEIGANFVARGGCATTPSPGRTSRTSWPLVLAALVIGLGFARNSRRRGGRSTLQR